VRVKQLIRDFVSDLGAFSGVNRLSAAMVEGR
jgi:hypothetical protein